MHNVARAEIRSLVGRCTRTGNCNTPVQEIRPRLAKVASGLGTFSLRAPCIRPRWVIPMLGGGTDGHTPVTRRASELERPQCMPHAGAVSFGRAPSPLVATGGEAVTATGKVSSLRVR
jgi:hypothetical protein